MELPWNICPYCGTPVPGMRPGNLDLDQALHDLQINGTQAESGDTEAAT
jgi:hypothetical protein